MDKILEEIYAGRTVLHSYNRKPAATEAEARRNRGEILVKWVIISYPMAEKKRSEIQVFMGGKQV